MPRKPLQQKLSPPTSHPSGLFSEQAFASAHWGGKIGIKTLTQNYENSRQIEIPQVSMFANHFSLLQKPF
jgi:hypothetical protein